MLQFYRCVLLSTNSKIALNSTLFFANFEMSLFSENSPSICKLSTSVLKADSGILSKRNEIFEIEKQRQIDNIPRIEKMQVHYKGVPEDVTLYLNKDLSTPFNVAQRKLFDIISRMKRYDFTIYTAAFLIRIS